MNSEIRNIVNILEDTITSKYKQIIQKNNLIDTGRLLREIKAKIIFLNDVEFKINIESPEYFKYLDEEYNISKEVFEDNDVDDYLSKLIDEIIFEDF